MQFKKFYFLVVLILVFSFNLVFAETLTISQKGNVRSGASIDSEIIAKVNVGDEVTQLEKKGEWYKVKLSGGKVGWVHEILVKKAEDWFFSGIVNFWTDKYEQAITDFTKVIKLDPKYPNVYLYRGISYASIGKYEQAIVDFTEMIKINPELLSGYYYRGLSYNYLGKYEKAIADYTDAIKINPKYAEAYYERALNYGVLGKTEAAIADCTEAIKIRPEYAEAYRIRGVSYAYSGKCDLAAVDLDKYLKLVGNENGDAEKIRQLIRDCGYTPKYQLLYNNNLDKMGFIVYHRPCE